MKLEASVAELAQLFQDFALVVDQQGELLNQIEFQIHQASDYIDEGNVEMVEAIDNLKAVRRKQCIIATIILVILAVALGVGLGEYCKGGGCGGSSSSSSSS